MKTLTVLKASIGFLAGVVITGLAGFAVFYKLVLYNAPLLDAEALPLDKKLHIVIPRGSSLSDIAQILEESGVIENAGTFVWAARYLQADRSLKAGQYLLPIHASNHQILSILQSSVPQVLRVTIPEGSSLQQLIRSVSARMPVDTNAFTALLRDTAFIRELGLPDTSLFGYLLPNTYFFDPGTGERDMIRIMVREFKSYYDEELKRRQAELGLSTRQVVTLASIIESETADDDERYLVSAVYHNRLRRGMLLQADPTIQFLLTDGPRRLYNKDLETDHPYNTYRYRGLPPGPINNPGKASILAALYPSNVDYLYMVADGTGTHLFSRTMAEHLKARKKLDRLRKELEKRGNR